MNLYRVTLRLDDGEFTLEMAAIRSALAVSKVKAKARELGKETDQTTDYDVVLVRKLS